MDKIVYDSLYKFLVSLGIIILIIPIVFVTFFFNTEPTLITKEEYVVLSEYSRNNLVLREKIITLISNYALWIVCGCTIIGLFLIIIGIINWKKVQGELDKEIRLKNEKQMKELSPIEQIEKIAAEISNDEEMSEDTTHIPSDENTKSNGTAQNMLDYVRCEQWMFSKLKNTLRNKYIVKSGIRAGKMEIDIVARSIHTNVDKLYEVKNLNKGRFNKLYLEKVISRLHQVAIEYENMYLRNTELHLCIFAPSQKIDNYKQQADAFLNSGEFFGHVELHFYDSDKVLNTD